LTFTCKPSLTIAVLFAFSPCSCSSGLPEVAAPKPEEAPRAPEPAPEPFEPLLPQPSPTAQPLSLFTPRRPPPPPEAPADLETPPVDARKTSSGLVTRVLQEGTGTQHPNGRSVVEVHYTGWTRDGRMFDSSVVRGQPASFPVDNLIRGWSEGLQLMVVGEKARFWIPAHLAYGDHPGSGAPAGPLVFDVELLDIKASGPP
jgi:peptidylprolyl isomerase